VLLINGVIAMIGMVMALLVYTIRVQFDITGGWLIVVGAVALWIYLFASDVVEDWIVERFNRGP
jgi:hypothetical protein